MYSLRTIERNMSKLVPSVMITILKNNQVFLTANKNGMSNELTTGNVVTVFSLGTELIYSHLNSCARASSAGSFYRCLPDIVAR